MKMIIIHEQSQPVSPRIHTVAELKSAIKGQQALFNMCEKGDIDQHLSPAIQVAIDCIAEVIGERIQEDAR